MFMATKRLSLALAVFLTTIATASAATFKIDVMTGPGTLGFSGYDFNDAAADDIEVQANDPVLVNYPDLANLLAITATRGQVIVTQSTSGGFPVITMSDCTGVFTTYCRAGPYDDINSFSVSPTGFDISIQGSAFARISSTTGRMLFSEDVNGTFWRNSLGTHLNFSSNQISHDILSFQVTQIPLPATGFLLIAGLGLIGATKRRSARTS